LYDAKFTKALSELDVIIATIPKEWLNEIPDALLAKFIGSE
jgi:hypothetical protein